MDVCYFTDSTSFGGAERALLTLLGSLDRERWEPTLSFHPSDALEPLVAGAAERGVPLWPVTPMPQGPHGVRPSIGFARAIRRRRPAVFHAHLSWPLACKFALAAAVMARVPAIVATEHLFSPFCLDASVLAQQRLLARGVDRYVAVSEETRRRLLEAFRWSPDKVDVIHNGVDEESFELTPRPDVRRELGAPPHAPLLLSAGRLHEQKGYPYLLRALAAVPGARLALAGDGPERPSLEKLTAELGLADRVLFLGWRDDVAELLTACQAFVLPSLYEGLPLTVLEAMAAGRPVIASRVGGIPEAVLDHETGLLVPPRDPRALAASIVRLLGDRALAERLGRAGRERVRSRFSAAAAARGTARVYSEILARSHRG